jgi:uncharacterized protein YneF (UPF0154 family)
MEFRREAVYTNLQTSVADFGMNKYQVQWQRISQMQQNASILLAIITFSITLLFQIINIQKTGKAILEISDWANVIHPPLFSSLFMGVISGYFLFKVIMVKKIKNDLPLPQDLYKELLATMEKNVVRQSTTNPTMYESDIDPPRYIGDAISRKITTSILEINSVVEGNQINYTKGLIISAFSIILNILIYCVIIINFQPTGVLLVVWDGLSLALVVSSILVEHKNPPPLAVVMS